MSKKFQALGNFALKVTSQSIFDFITGIINTHKFRMTVKRKIFKPILHFPQELSKYWESFEQKWYMSMCVFFWLNKFSGFFIGSILETGTSTKANTAWKVSVFPVILVRTFPHLDSIWRLDISSYSVQMRKNADQNNAEYGHFLCSVKLPTDLKIVTAMTPEQG